nr:unknown [Zea mays]
MGILLVYDVTDESSFNNIRNWIRNIEQHASDNVNKILVGNKADMDESKRVRKLYILYLYLIIQTLYMLNFFRKGCAHFKGTSSRRRIWDKVL